MGFIRCKLNPLKLKDRVGHMFLTSGNQFIKHFFGINEYVRNSAFQCLEGSMK